MSDNILQFKKPVKLTKEDDERITRIKNSLDKINNLMSELRGDSKITDEEWSAVRETIKKEENEKDNS